VSTCAIAPGRNVCAGPVKTITLTGTQVSRGGVGPVPFLPGGSTVLRAFSLQVNTGPSVGLSRSDGGGNTFTSRFIGLGGGGPLAYGPGDAISTVYNDFDGGDSRDFTHERMPTDGSEVKPRRQLQHDAARAASGLAGARGRVDPGRLATWSPNVAIGNGTTNSLAVVAGGLRRPGRAVSAAPTAG
jgi:hypothetical protein